jgi:hypothetical protein
MNPELEKLIDFALADDVITDKEREIIRKKAEKLGEDPDEAEMILEAKLAIQNKDRVASSSPPSPTPPPVAAATPTPPPSMPPPTAKQKSSKVGNIMTCPACGSTVNSRDLNCNDCGHEFRNVGAINSIKEFYKKYMSIESDERERADKKEQKWYNEGIHQEETKKAIIQQQISLVSTFPVPNTQEDFMEFLNLAIPEATKDLGLGWLAIKMGAAHKDYVYVQLQNAWKSKCNQVIMKARQLINDASLINQVELYANKLK